MLSRSLAPVPVPAGPRHRDRCAVPESRSGPVPAPVPVVVVCNRCAIYYAASGAKLVELRAAQKDRRRAAGMVRTRSPLYYAARGAWDTLLVEFFALFYSRRHRRRRRKSPISYAILEIKAGGWPIP